MIFEIPVVCRQINNNNIEKANFADYLNCFVLNLNFNYFFHAEYGIVLSLFCNFEQNWDLCSNKVAHVHCTGCPPKNVALFYIYLHSLL